MRNERYIARYFCSVDNPDAVRTWFVFDRQTGAPLSDEDGIRMFTGEEIRDFLRASTIAPIADDDAAPDELSV
jgi:hypothetical protein